mmetsp:Transcript_11926/g.33590  ORF Transcript_11926/g.33590 Transcript_11926/m.33590 type:complete len:201 (+) Transcript_11926:329-931(+)
MRWLESDCHTVLPQHRQYHRRCRDHGAADGLCSAGPGRRHPVSPLCHMDYEQLHRDSRRGILGAEPLHIRRPRRALHGADGRPAGPDVPCLHLPWLSAVLPDHHRGPAHRDSPGLHRAAALSDWPCGRPYPLVHQQSRCGCRGLHSRHLPPHLPQVTRAPLGGLPAEVPCHLLLLRHHHLGLYQRQPQHRVCKGALVARL